MGHQRRVTRRDAVKPPLCKCYNKKGNPHIRKTLSHADNDAKAFRKQRVDFFFESDSKGVDKVRSFQQYPSKVVLLNMQANPRYRENCKQCGLQIPVSNIQYIIPEEKSRGKGRRQLSAITARVVIQKGISTRKSISSQTSTLEKFQGKNSASEKADANENNSDQLAYPCNSCDMRFINRKTRNMHQLEHNGQSSVSSDSEDQLDQKSKNGRQRSRGRRGKILIRKKLKAKSYAPRPPSEALEKPSKSSMNGRHLVVKLEDIRARLRTVVVKGKKRFVLDD